MTENIKKKRLLIPKYDVVFQALFGVKGSEEILRELLSSLLGRKVENVQLNENQILTKEYPDEKLGILDLIANINNNETVNIEIQLKNQYNTEKRILYYWSRIYGKRIKEGEDYKQLNKTISIMLINYELEELEMKKILDDNSVRNHLTEEGRLEGEKMEKKKIAKKLLSKGMNIEDVSEITGLTKEEIEKL